MNFFTKKAAKPAFKPLVTISPLSRALDDAQEYVSSLHGIGTDDINDALKNTKTGAKEAVLNKLHAMLQTEKEAKNKNAITSLIDIINNYKNGGRRKRSRRKRSRRTRSRRSRR